MDWTRSETLALAAPGCNLCLGMGTRIGREDSLLPCNCVLRAIFRACLEQFRSCVTRNRYLSQAPLEPARRRERRAAWSRKDEEYAADFCLVSRRHLDDQEYRIFRYHFLLGADWRMCCRKLELDRGNLFHAIYRIEHRLGKIFRELEPYALYPVDDYYHGPIKVVTSCTPPALVHPIRPPVRDSPPLPSRKTA